MVSIYVARSPKLGRWASDVGLGRHVYKVGVTEGDPKAIVAQGWAGETDWTIVRKREVEELSEGETLGADSATRFSRHAVCRTLVDTRTLGS